ncbi:MAG: hypothetical protein ABI836_03985 [Gemmatimonadota bacterium]
MQDVEPPRDTGPGGVLPLRGDLALDPDGDASRATASTRPGVGPYPSRFRAWKAESRELRGV